MSATRTKSSLDFLLRLVFFATAPFLVVFVAALFPITGALVQIGFALAVFFAGEAARRLAARSKIATRMLRNQLAFEEYYRENPPRSFLYYVFYPLLFPYWIVVHEARREFLLFKGYTLASFALLVVSLTVQYASAFPPELGVRDFAPIALGTFGVETIVVLMFLMPIVTSVVHFHGLGAPRRLSVLLVAGLVSTSLAIVKLERRRDPVVSFATRSRVRLREHARPAAARKAAVGALLAAWKALPKEQGNVDSDGKIEGVVLEKAQEALARFYKNDEAHAFDVWYSKKSANAVIVVYFEAQRGHRPIWLAMNRARETIDDPKQLPRGAFVAMKHASE